MQHSTWCLLLCLILSPKALGLLLTFCLLPEEKRERSRDGSCQGRADAEPGGAGGAPSRAFSLRCNIWAPPFRKPPFQSFYFPQRSQQMALWKREEPCAAGFSLVLGLACPDFPPVLQGLAYLLRILGFGGSSAEQLVLVTAGGGILVWMELGSCIFGPFCRNKMKFTDFTAH